MEQSWNLEGLMKVPIFLNEAGNVLVFESVENAERYAEPIDVANEEYIAYDSEGRLLELYVLEKTNRVKIRAAEMEPTHSTELQKAIVDFLSYAGISREWLSNASLNDLVTKMLDYKTV
jgi:hypothetical protein